METNRQPNVHESVLPEQVVSLLELKPGGRYIDGTLGAGGHASRILAAQPTIELLGIDRDADILAIAEQSLTAFRRRARLMRGDYADMRTLAAELGWTAVDGILLDLGVSSLQIDRPERGFSFRNDGPLDMRMDRRAEVTASVIVNTRSEQELARIFREYGEEPRARRLAKAIVAHRAERPIGRTGELAEIIRGCLGRSTRSLPTETRAFQALRIAVNDELGQLERGLDEAHALLAPQGRLVVISFHSLEDRVVKHRFQSWEKPCICPPGMPVCGCGRQPSVRIVTRQPVTADDTELRANRRAASAKLRCCEKLPPPTSQAA